MLIVLLLFSMFFVPLSITGDGNGLVFASSEPIQNTERLPATDVSELPHHRAPLSLLVFSQFADLDEGSDGEFKNTMESIRNTYNLPFDHENLTDYMDLEAKLWDFDVFLIPEQEDMGASNLSDVVDEWGDLLLEWVTAGGIIVLMDCAGSGFHGPTMRIYNQTGLMNTMNPTYDPSTDVYINDVNSPLTQGVASTWTTPDGAVFFNTSDGNVVVDDGVSAFVAHKIIGKGHVVLLGFDFYSTEPNQEIILANAIRLHRHIVFDQSHSPEYTVTSGFQSFVADLQDMGYACSGMTTFDHDYLLASDVLVLSISNMNYTSADADIIEEFVTGGGGLFIASDWVQFGDELDTVLERFGFERNKDYGLEDSDDLVGNALQFASFGENIIYHSATMSVSSVEVYAGAGFIQTPDDAVTLIETDSDGTTTFGGGAIANQTTMSAAVTVGDGRVIVFSDTSTLEDINDWDGDLTDNYNDADNALFLTNCIRWLTAAGLEEISVVFDESHSPHLSLPSSYRGIAELLTENGFTVYRMADFDSEYFEDKDVLLVQDGTIDYNPTEIQSIKDFVSAGNGLLLLGCYSVYGAQVDLIANEYGISLDTSGPWIEGNISYVSNLNETHFSDHPIMDGISNIQRAAATGLSAIGDSTPLVTTSDDGI
ncbi:MAG: DUF4350 domain-containing protein, partial [Candidatus Thorarchaeota archaeon]